MRRISAVPPVPASDGSRSRDLDEIRRFAMPRPQEGCLLARRWREHENREVAHRIVTSHLQSVIGMSRHLGGGASPDAPLREEVEWQDWPADDGASHELSFLAEDSEARLSAAREALRVLGPRERRVFEARRLAEDPITLAELSSELGISRERVHQIEASAFEQVQDAVKKNMSHRARPRAEAVA